MAVITTEVGASPEKVESDVVKPMESTLGTINGVEKLTSTSANNYGMLMLEFAEDTNMDSFGSCIESAEFIRFAGGLRNTQYHGNQCGYDGNDVCQCQL